MFVRFIDWLASPKKPCALCEELKSLQEIERYERRELLKAILEQHKPIATPECSEGPKEIIPKSIPWRIRQQMLEKEDREKAEKLRSTEDLERVLEITNG